LVSIIGTGTLIFVGAIALHQAGRDHDVHGAAARRDLDELLAVHLMARRHGQQLDQRRGREPPARERLSAQPIPAALPN
jgi:hypothetical protein